MTYDEPTPEELTNRFTYHAPKDDQPWRYERIRAAQRAFAEVVLACVPLSRERDLAQIYLENAGLWANAGIARNE